MSTTNDYIPAMGRNWLLPLYDPFTRLAGARALHRRLVAQAAIGPDHDVLDVGTGTGNVALTVARRHPAATVTGLDPDPLALARAELKADRAGLPVRWVRGFGGDLPFEAASFDRVLTALALHHLDGPAQVAALAEIRRVLRPGGSLHIVDFGGEHEHNPLRRNRRLAANSGDAIPQRLREAGFTDVTETGHRSVLGSRCTFFKAAG
ncbi:class I SAM-dependent methyltransferase [Actinomycetes bacterium KLBMP 9759]